MVGLPLTSSERLRLFAEAFRLKTDAARCRRVQALHTDGSRETLELALDACRSEDPLKREIGADVLSQLGYQDSKPYWAESTPALVALLHDTDANVIQAAVQALGNLAWEHADSMGTVVPRLLELVDHPDSDVRLALATSLPRFASHPAAIDALIKLTCDRVGEIRDWATFGLGQTEVDTAEVRSALLVRLGDRHRDTRWEALQRMTEGEWSVDQSVREALEAWDSKAGGS